MPPKGTPKKPPANRQKLCRKDVAPKLPPWAETAYRLWCRGQRNYTQIGRQLGPPGEPIDFRTVKANIRKFGALVRAEVDSNDIDALNEAIAAEEEVRSEAWRVYSDPASTQKDKVAALRVIQTSNETLAGLNGVVTKRIGLQHSNDPENPMTFQIIQFGADDHGGGNREPSPAGD